MFSIFRSRVVKHGEQCAQSICDAVVDKEVIMQLILEDIEGASMGKRNITKTLPRSTQPFEAGSRRPQGDKDVPGSSCT